MGDTQPMLLDVGLAADRIDAGRMPEAGLREIAVMPV
jgi:hypothetical protein